jgi:nitrate/TMAO reductase-like tetraheme cytochrome c subunit
VENKPTIAISPLAVSPSKPRRWPIYVAGIFIALVLLGGVSFAAATALEEHDSFCILCHTAPEVTYYNRAYIALDNPNEAFPDLATVHYHLAQAKNLAPFRCIDCHRGDASLGDRISTLSLGARDIVIYVTGHENPTIEKHGTQSAWLANDSCIGCHSATLLKLDGINNHFHTYLPQARTALGRGGTLVISDALRAAVSGESAADQAAHTSLRTINISLLCSDCHQPHETLPGSATSAFMDADLRNAACVDCHIVAKQGPQDVRGLPGNTQSR